jgi:TolB-like protein/Flp pilus assembly protein TadD
MIERNDGLAPEQRIEFRIGVHLGDIVEESDGDLMGDGVNIAARLEGIAMPGAICLSEDAYRQVKGRLDLVITDLGPIQLKNISEPIRVYSLEAGKPAEAKSTPVRATEKSAPPRLSIVVLPFANIGGGAEQDYFVDGVTESLTTDLSRIRGSFVIGRNTAFTYKGKAVDLKQIGRELNVRYVLEGSVQRGGNRMRVNVQLIDAESGSHLWAERFDKPLADLFDMQDEIVARLAGSLNAQLVEVEARRAENSPNPDSMDLYFQGEALTNKGFSLEFLARAQDFYNRAIAADPLNVDAQVASARADIQTVTMFQAGDRSATLATAESKLISALALVPDNARGHVALGLVYYLTKRPSECHAQCEHALALDRNLANAHVWIGASKMHFMRPDETEAHVLDAIRLSPRDTSLHIWAYIAGLAKFFVGHYDQAFAWLRRSIEANRNHPYAHFVMGATLVRLGRLDEARSAIKYGLAQNPRFTISRHREVWAMPADGPDSMRLQALHEPLWEAMRLAGVPEQ